MEFTAWWKKYGDPFTAISVLIFIVFAVYSIVQDQNHKEEISLSCGWAEENYRCTCEKSEVIRMENEIEGTPIDLSEINFTSGETYNVPLVG